VIVAPLPLTETDRLDALQSLKILDTPSEPAYDDLTQLASVICATPIALISLVDQCRQWFKSKVGLDAVETHRDLAFCAHAILGNDLFIVPDAAQDIRFCDNPLVVGGPKIRFYAGMPLTDTNGYNLGTLCVIDQVPRQLSEQQQESLRSLGRQVTAQFALRLQVERLSQTVAELQRLEADLQASDRKFRAIFDTMFEFIGLLSPDGTLLEANRTALDAVGVHRADVVGRPFPECVWWEHDSAMQAKLRDAIRRAAAGEFVRFETTHCLANGVLANIDFSLNPVLDGNGKVILLVPEGRDITDLKRAEIALSESEQRFRSVLEELAEGVFLVDNSDGKIVYANSSCLNMLAFTAEEMADVSPFEIVIGENPETVVASVKALKEKTPRERNVNLGQQKYRRKDGVIVDVEVQATYVPNAAAGLTSFILRDISEQTTYEKRLFEYQLGLEDANARLRVLAMTDSLTGVHNRAAFDGKLAEEHDRATRYTHPLSLMLIDVDQFKEFNDLYGHRAGDDVLRTVANLLQETVRNIDFVARYGGEEFVVLLPDTDYGGAMVLAERCRRVVANYPWDKRVVTISIGVATLTSAAMNAEMLVEQADKAMYRSKQKGRNQITHGTGLLNLR
jgi:diguanylate cyclase (GGDEF)-like protein/PAS domain S-box-containing protein